MSTDTKIRELEAAWAAEHDIATFVTLYAARKRAGLLTESLQGDSPADLSGHDWLDVFKYASGVPASSWSDDGDVPQVAGAMHTGQTAEPFSLGNVRFVIASVEGENDGLPWEAIVELHDGRFGFVEAGCDYTGWG